jgi:uncharacterized protein (TIGR02284 family)
LRGVKFALLQDWAFLLCNGPIEQFWLSLIEHPSLLGGSMNKDNPKSVLQNVIDTARDGEKGFREAAEHFKSTELKSMAQRVSAERAGFARELEPELRSEGKDERPSGTAAGSMHRAWIDIQTALGGGDHTILAWLEQGEDHAKKIYNEALQSTLPSSSQLIVRRQYDRVVATHDQVKALRDQSKAA